MRNTANMARLVFVLWFCPEPFPPPLSLVVVPVLLLLELSVAFEAVRVAKR